MKIWLRGELRLTGDPDVHESIHYFFERIEPLEYPKARGKPVM